MQLHGRDFNPKQKGLTLGDGTYMPKVTVRHNYLDMIDDGIKSLKENMPDLFKQQVGKLKLQPGGKITPEYAFPCKKDNLESSSLKYNVSLIPFGI